jgi:hypothetical protein
LVENLPVNKKNASRESGIREIFRAETSPFVRRRVAGAATAGQLNAIHAKPSAAKFPRVKTAAAFARGILGRTGGFGFHDFSTAKYSKYAKEFSLFAYFAWFAVNSLF